MPYASDIYGNREPIHLPDEKSIQAWQRAMLARIRGLESEQEEESMTEPFTYDSPALVDVQFKQKIDRMKLRTVEFCYRTAKIGAFAVIPLLLVACGVMQFFISSLVWVPILGIFIMLLAEVALLFQCWEGVGGESRLIAYRRKVMESDLEETKLLAKIRQSQTSSSTALNKGGRVVDI